MAYFEAPAWSVRAWPQGIGKGTPVDISERILQLEYEDDESKADKLALDVENFDLRNFDSPIIRAGVALEAAWGYAGRMCPARALVVQSVKGFSVLKVEALDRSILMHKQVKSRTFAGKTRSEVVEQIARENGYVDAAFRKVQTTGVRYEHITQARQTDAAFMASLAAKEGFIFFVDVDGLHWHERDLNQRPIRTFRYYNGSLSSSDCIVGTPTIENDVTAKPGKVTKKGIDPITKATLSATADSNTKRDGLAEDQEVVTPTGDLIPVTGQDGVQRDGLGMNTLAPSSDPTAAGTAAAAAGQFKAGQLLAAQLSFQALGDPGMLAKSIIEVSFPGAKSISGKYYVSNVRHALSSSGYIMTLKCKRDGRSSAAGKVANPSKADPNNLAPVDPDALNVQDVSTTGAVSQVYQDTRGRGG